MTSSEITEADRKLIEELRTRIKKELELVPEYNDDFSLMRWIIGWDRKLDVIVPKLSFSLRAINALGLNKMDLNTLEKVTDECDSCSEPLQYLPGSLIGIDKENNVVSLQCIGKLDAAGLMPCTRNSDLYRMRITESEGVMQILRAMEKKLGKPLGTSVIFDLDGLSMAQVDMSAMKVITSMLSQLQELFPDVVRKIYIINAPSFIQMLWGMVSPCLAKQTQQKVKILGNNWKEVLVENIGEEVLYEHWGGIRKAETEYGNVRMGGKIPAHLSYDPANDLPAEKLTKLTVSARSTTFVPITLEGHVPGRKLYWWWRLEANDVHFAIYRSAEGQEKVAEHPDDYMCHPKFKLQTEFVPEDGEILAEEPGVYKFVFDNTHSKLRSKTIRYFIESQSLNGQKKPECGVTACSLPCQQMHLLLLFLATIATVRSECGQDEVFKSCGTHCEASCLDLEPLCKADCLADVCQCDKGFVRHEGKCIFPTFCPKTCKINEELLQCGTACEPSCADPDPMICTKQCLVDVCQCKSGFVRNQEGECVELSRCPATTPTPESVEEK